MSKYTGVVVSDIHIGMRATNKLYYELLSLLIDNLLGFKKLDFIVIAGDFFDRKLYVNEEASKIALDIMNQLIIICRKFDAKLRIVYGTESHEVRQYNIFDSIANDIDYRVIRTVEEEELFPDLKVLYVPEEYIYDKAKHYKKFFKKENEYDYIFGHGVVSEVMTAVKEKERTTEMRTVPVFRVGELFKICKGQIYFGHYHVNSSIQDKFFYVGSFSRWMYGEEEDKGYYIIKADTDKEKYTNEFVPNTMCDMYKTLSFSYDKMRDEKDIDASFKRADEIINKKLYDNVRFIFNLPVDSSCPEFIIELIKEKYRNKKNVKYEIVNGYIDKEKQRKKTAVREEYDKYAYLFDKSASLTDKVKWFISLEYEKDMDLDEIHKYIYSSLDNILKEP